MTTPEPETLAQLVETHPQAPKKPRTYDREGHTEAFEREEAEYDRKAKAHAAAQAAEPTTRVRAPYTSEIVEVPVDSPVAQEALADHPTTDDRIDAEIARVRFNAPVSALTVYIDAYPVKGEAKNLDGYVQGILTAVCDTYKVADVRLGSQGSDLGYGKWKAVLAVCVATQPPAPGTYYLLSRGNEVLEVMAQAIVEAADVAVVGR